MTDKEIFKLAKEYFRYELSYPFFEVQLKAFATELRTQVRRKTLLKLRQRLTDNDETVQWNIDDMIGEQHE